MGHRASRETAERYVAAYQAALSQTRGGTKRKRRAREKAARVLGVGQQRVADVLVEARRMGLDVAVLPPLSGMPWYRSTGIRVALNDVVREVCASSYVGGLYG